MIRGKLEILNEHADRLRRPEGREEMEEKLGIRLRLKLDEDLF